MKNLITKQIKNPHKLNDQHRLIFSDNIKPQTWEIYHLLTNHLHSFLFIKEKIKGELNEKKS